MEEGGRRGGIDSGGRRKEDEGEGETGVFDDTRRDIAMSLLDSAKVVFLIFFFIHIFDIWSCPEEGHSYVPPRQCKSCIPIFF